MDEQPCDDRLVELTIAGDKGAFAILVERYRRRVFEVALRRLGNAADADDAAQETLVRAYTHLTSYRPNGRFEAWLLAITVHWCIDQHRTAHSRLIWEDLDSARDLVATASKTAAPETLALDEELRRTVRREVAALPEHYRLILVLRYWHDLTYGEIAALIDQPISTVRMRLYRARSRCRQLLPEKVDREDLPSIHWEQRGAERQQQVWGY